MSLIGKDIVDKLKLTGIKRTINISNAVTNTRKISSEAVNFIITPQTNVSGCFNIGDAHIINKSNIPNNIIDKVVIKK